MSIASEHPPDVGQIYAALVALHAEPVADPELRPAGPREEDRLLLLGSLLAKVELEITAATRLDDDQDIADTLTGWRVQAGPNPGIHFNVVINRLLRTARQLVDPEDLDVPAGREAACAAVVASGEALSAHLHAAHGDMDGTRRALDRAERSVIDLLDGLHAVRVDLGDTPE